jgi:hypothetical protein
MAITTSRINDFVEVLVWRCGEGETNNLSIINRVLVIKFKWQGAKVKTMAARGHCEREGPAPKAWEGFSFYLCPLPRMILMTSPFARRMISRRGIFAGQL